MPGIPSINCRRFIYTGIMLLFFFSMLIPSHAGRAQVDKQTDPPQPTPGITEGGTPAASDSTQSIQQFSAGGYVLGFQNDGFMMAGMDHILKSSAT